MLRPVVFLDRDGTLNHEAGYLREIDQLRLLPGAAKAVQRLNELNIATVLVTNQSGPARGIFPEAHVVSLNQRLAELLNANGAKLDAMYYCPHHVDGIVSEYAIKCGCRKPEVGLLEKAFIDLGNLDRSRAYMVGDQSTDIELAKNAGIKSVLVKTGFGDDVLSGRFQWKVQADHAAGDVVEAVEWIISDLAKTGWP
jgi:D-glycero-D-manno-heptose 1,7-bisphosphate phosphatase